MMLRKLSAILFILAFTSAAYSHGTKYEIVRSGRIDLKAMYDTGVVMANADVMVFSPGSTTVAWKVKTDEKGIFHFTPDTPGTWILQVRDKSGHGMRINLDIDESLSLREESSGSGGGLSMIQKTVMAICVVWGFTGTGLYFKRKKGES